MTNEEQRAIHERYSKLLLSADENNAIYDCYMQGVNHDGHVWVTWTDVERLICDLQDVRGDIISEYIDKQYDLAYEHGYLDAINKLTENLQGDILAYASSGHALDVSKWLKDYIESEKEKMK